MLDKDMCEYKIAQLREMARVEANTEANAPDRAYGGHLSHATSSAKPINLDAEALQALVEHYEKRLKNTRS
jgi:hypothetical protein